MKYKNGRTAQVGDQLLDLTTGQTGVIYSISEQLVGNCRLVGMTNLDPWVTLSECLHIDDIRAADVPDLTFVPPVDEVVEMPVALPLEAPEVETETVESVVDPTDPIQPPQEPYPGDEPADTNPTSAVDEEATPEVTEQEQVTEEPAIKETVADEMPVATE